MPAPFLLDAADAAAIAEAATSREPNDYGRYYEEYDDDDEVRWLLLCVCCKSATATVRKHGNVVLACPLQAPQKLVESRMFL